MNYREKIRKAIECPQFGNEHYGEWGALTLEQRKYIKRLLDELDSADNYLKKVYLENKKYKEVIDKIQKHCEIEINASNHYLKNHSSQKELCHKVAHQRILDILKEV